MSDASANAPPAVAKRQALHIVLFGLPGAGKSSLLGALAQAAQTQEHLLHGRLSDPSHGLAELQHRLYEEEPRRTGEEVVPYPVDFEPFAEDGPPANRHLGAVLIDCDGRVANDLLIRRRSLPEDTPEGTLAAEVLAADTLVLVLDASAPSEQVDADFAEFGRFLRILERSRSSRSEVGGLPVFLVLTKCDLLAQSNDAPADWLGRIDQRKRQVDQRFNDFLQRRTQEEGSLPFGRIELHVGATAVKRPPLAGIPAKPREPYGVAELFRQCLDAARSFRQRRRRSSRLLAWTVAGAGTVVVGMVALTVALLGGVGPSERRPGDLENRIENYRAMEGATPSERLRGDVRALEEKQAVLAEFKQSSEFASLPEGPQQFVTDRLEELQAYLAYYKKLLASRQPADARSEQELQAIEKSLKTKGGDGLAVPRDEWSQTRAARLHHDRLEDAKLLRRAVEEIEENYQQKLREGERLWTLADFQSAPGTINWRGWHNEVQRYLATIARPTPAESEKLPGAASPDLTYQTAYNFERVRHAAAELDGLKKRLEGFRDLTTALGLGGSPARALLVLPIGFTAAAAADRLRDLQKAFPEFKKSFPEVKVPEAAKADIQQAARASYKPPLVQAGQDVVLRHLQEASPGGPETVKTWQSIRPWLAEPADLAAWRVLARVLLRLAEPERQDPDPVADLAAFLARDSFEIRLQRLTLELPDILRLRPDGEFMIFQIDPATKKETTLAFTIGEKQRETQRGATTYTLRPKDGSSLTYRPGDNLNAELFVRDSDNRELKLTWARGRSQVYQFEHLLREPRLHARAMEPSRGQLEPRIRLEIAPGHGNIPLVPDLIPVVKFQ
jgi:hypothetical protein